MFRFETDFRRASAMQHWLVTIVLFAATLVVGILVKHLGVVYELVGGTSLG